MDHEPTEPNGSRPHCADRGGADGSSFKLGAARIYAALVIAVSAWFLHGFVQALLAAGVTALASWPAYTWFRARSPRRLGRGAVSTLFTVVMSVFVLGPIAFAFSALLTESNAMLQQLVAADREGIAMPPWLQDLPLVGPWIASRWQSEFAHPGALVAMMQHASPFSMLDWAGSLGQFMVRHLFIAGFMVLLLFFFYQEGDALAADLDRVLRQNFGERVEPHLALATRAVRATVNSMVVVGLFDGFVIAAAYAVIAVPRPALWAAIIGILSAVPALGYVAVLALVLQMAIGAHANSAMLACVLGMTVLFCGDKIVRPVVARNGVRLPLAWILMGCVGGFEALGLVGLVVGPVVLGVARDLWDQRVRSLARSPPMTPADGRH